MIIKTFTFFVITLVAMRESISFVLSEPIRNSGSGEGAPLHDHNFRVVRSAFVGETDCSQKPDPGPCKAIKHRYYWDDQTSDCKEFIYGGCLGNSNNFMTYEDCVHTCKPQS